MENTVISHSDRSENQGPFLGLLLSPTGLNFDVFMCIIHHHLQQITGNLFL